MQMDSPCHGCARRTVGCHASCADYSGWARDMAEHNKSVRAKKLLNTVGWDGTMAHNVRKDINSRVCGLRIYK